MILTAKDADDGRRGVACRRVGDTRRAPVRGDRPGLAARLRGVEAQRARAYALAVLGIGAFWWCAVNLSWWLWAVTR